MNSDNRIAIIKDRLKKAFSPTYLEVLNESDQHIGHAGHQGGNRHFFVCISSPHFNGISRLQAHRLIYSEFSDMMPEQIHALRIKILNN